MVMFEGPTTALSSQVKETKRRVRGPNDDLIKSQGTYGHERGPHGGFIRS